MHRRAPAGGHDEREEAERLVFRAIERVLADAAAHAARFVRRRAALRQPAVRREQRAERRPQRLDARGGVANLRGQARRLRDERADLRRVDEKPVRLRVIVSVTLVAHGSSDTHDSYTEFSGANSPGLCHDPFGSGVSAGPAITRPCAHGLEARAVARAVPRALGAVPFDEARPCACRRPTSS